MDIENKIVKYSETFNSIQGEGYYTGVPTVWLRYFSCNLTCDGFGQTDPTSPETYELPYEAIDLTDITEVEQLPVFERGCDSSYTWSKRFRHLMREGTPSEVKERLKNELRTSSNPNGLFQHPKSLQRSHMCFTGGEPLTKVSSLHSAEIVKQFILEGNAPASVTYETNGTQKLTPEFIERWNWIKSRGVELFFSVSPKLWTVAGEKPEKAIKPEVVQSYYDLGCNGQLKFVLGSEQRQWNNMEEELSKFRSAGVDWPVWVMPVGAREEEQMETAGDVATMALERGYNVAARVHTYLWGNAIGT